MAILPRTNSRRSVVEGNWWRSEAVIVASATAGVVVADPGGADVTGIADSAISIA